MIRKTLDLLPYNANIEVIVADGQSQDRTVEFAKQYPVKVIKCTKNRAMQMNKGAEVSHGKILLFLHADCLLEEESFKAIENCLDSGYIGGCLTQKIDSNRLIYRAIETSGNIRARVFKVFYGDQAIFVRCDIFLKLGGFDTVPLFEDVLFSRKMRREGRTAMVSKTVYASSRRWEKNGVLKTTFIYWLLTLGFHLRIPFVKLKRIYDDTR